MKRSRIDAYLTSLGQDIRGAPCIHRSPSGEYLVLQNVMEIHKGGRRMVLRGLAAGFDTRDEAEQWIKDNDPG